MAYLEGTDNYDVFKNYSTNDTYNAKGGNDYIYDYAGNDTYIYNRGDGQDTVQDVTGYDTLSFGAGITLNDLQFVRFNNNFIVRIKGSTDKIDFQNWLADPKYKIERIQFTNGAAISGSDAESRLETDKVVIIASGYSDVINGSTNSEIIYAMGGSDAINSGSGNDEIEAASGNDTITDSSGNDIYFASWGNDIIRDYQGNDTYYFNLGDDQDTVHDYDGYDIIVFGQGIYQNNLEFVRENNNQIIRIKNTTDRITIADYFSSDQNKIEKIILADGTVIGGNTTPVEPPPIIPPTDPPSLEDPPSNITPTVVGTDGYDNFTGYNSNDIYYGKKGNDYFKDYSGSDTYVFNKGDGQDTVQDSNGMDTIHFGAGIFKSDLTFTQNNSALTIGFTGNSDKINVINWFSQDKYKIEKLQFQDGSTLSILDIQNIMNGISKTIEGTDNSETINGTALSDTINAKSGNDTIYCYGGNDVITGGTGNDNIIGSSGNDKYIFNPGDGQDIIQETEGTDTIQFSNGISEDNIEFSRNADDFVITVKNTTDKITIKNWFTSIQNKIERLDFADGSYLTSDQVENKIIDTNTPSIIPTVTGTDGYDLFQGYNQNDIYYLKKGNDRVKDYSGNDTYLFYRGDGWDNITDSSGSDTIKFLSGITKEEIAFQQNGNSLSVSLKSSSDGLTIVDWFSQDKYKIERLEFDNGSYLTSASINQIIQQMSSFNIQTEPELLSISSNTSLPLTDELVNSY